MVFDVHVMSSSSIPSTARPRRAPAWAIEGVGTLAIDLQTVLGLPDGDADTGQFMLEGGKAICFVAANVCDPTNTGRALGKGRDCGYHGGELARLVQVDVNRLEGMPSGISDRSMDPSERVAAAPIGAAIWMNCAPG